jgi:hypothetical protein
MKEKLYFKKFNVISLIKIKITFNAVILKKFDVFDR